MRRWHSASFKQTWQMNTVFCPFCTCSTAVVAHTHIHTHLSASATWFPVCEHLSDCGALVSWVRDLHILFFWYAAGHRSWNHLTHQHAQQVTAATITMTEAEEMHTSETSTER